LYDDPPWVTFLHGWTLYTAQLQRLISSYSEENSKTLRVKHPTKLCWLARSWWWPAALLLCGAVTALLPGRSARLPARAALVPCCRKQKASGPPDFDLLPLLLIPSPGGRAAGGRTTAGYAGLSMILHSLLETQYADFIRLALN
jgi:hypothetical protein